MVGRLPVTEPPRVASSSLLSVAITTEVFYLSPLERDADMEHKLHFNGVMGTTGRYLTKEMTIAEAAVLIRDVSTTKQERDTQSAKIGWLQRTLLGLTQRHFGLPLGVQPDVVKQAGWAVVFHTDEDPAVRSAVQCLFEHRAKQIGDPSIVKQLEYRTNESRAEWLARHGVGAGAVIPSRVPFYLLFIGSPARIPFSFVHEIDVEYCAGFLHFDTALEYSSYAQSVIAYENAAVAPNRKEVVFFGPRHSWDAATQMSADLLVRPLSEGTPASGATPASQGIADEFGFDKRTFLAKQATKAALLDVLRGTESRPSALLFTASHGMAWPKGHANQLSAQGALLCQDWPAVGDIAPTHYLAAQDVPADARVHGMIAFHFACYGGGTPLTDRFVHEPGMPPPTIAEQPFVAALPRRLLTHPGGGALACIGHVERAWGYSIVTPDAGPQLIPFQNAIGRILTGQPVGYAMKDFNERFAVLSTSLANLLQQAGYGATVDDFMLASAWIERNDAEGYLLLGDPAVRLRTDKMTN